MPLRIQHRRYTKLPPNTQLVARPSRFGNPFKIGENGMTRAEAIVRFRRWIEGKLPDVEPERRQRLLASLPELRGQNLACYCKAGEECHADVLLELASRESLSLPGLSRSGLQHRTDGECDAVCWRSPHHPAV